MTTISAVVEGDVDAAIVRRLAAEAGLTVTRMHVKLGKQNVRSRIAGYNKAARHVPFFVLVDLDREFDCAPDLVSNWLQNREPALCFRVAVRAVEAWLIGDAERLASFLGVRRNAIPADPEQIDDPKRTLVAIASSSRVRAIREDFVPRPGSGRIVGQAYTSRIIDFISIWRPDVASRSCDSLRRARNALLVLGTTSALLS